MLLLLISVRIRLNFVTFKLRRRHVNAILHRRVFMSNEERVEYCGMIWAWLPFEDYCSFLSLTSNIIH